MSTNLKTLISYHNQVLGTEFLSFKRIFWHFENEFSTQVDIKLQYVMWTDLMFKWYLYIEYVKTPIFNHG